MEPESDLVLPGIPGPWARPLAFVDTETTGLSSSVCEIIDVAVIRAGMPWSSKVQITEFDEARADSRERPNSKRTWRDVTGYSREAWADAPLGSIVAHS